MRKIPSNPAEEPRDGNGQFASLHPENRFWVKVCKTGHNGCWVWMGAKNKSGYGRFWMNPTYAQAHRFAYLVVKGEIPDGMHLDHLCRNRSCVNPDHLEPVTPKENTRRGMAGTHPNSHSHMRDKTHCPSGHEYKPENILYHKGERHCRECNRIKSSIYYHQHKRAS